MLIFCVFSWREPSPLESLYNLHLSFKTQIEDFLWYLTWVPWHLWKNRLLLLLCIYFFYDLMSFFLSFNNISLYEIVILKRSGAMSHLPLAPQCIAQCLAHRKCLINVKRTDDWINGHVRKFSGWENGNEQNFKSSQWVNGNLYRFTPPPASKLYSPNSNSVVYGSLWLWNITTSKAALWHYWITGQENRKTAACRIFFFFQIQFSIKTVGNFHLNNFCFVRSLKPGMSQSQKQINTINNLN